MFYRWLYFYRCPFMASICTKTNHQIGDPVPVCSLYRRGVKREEGAPPICICPNRFFEADVVGDVIRECWGRDPHGEIRTAHEVRLDKFGKVDLVIAELYDNGGEIRRFLPVEIQAVDITGTYRPYYEALVESRVSEKASYGFNWANVRKRFITQLVSKGAICSRWDTKIVAVVQEDLFEKFQEHAEFTEARIDQANVVFLTYQFTRSAADDRWGLQFSRVFPTTHGSLMTASLYERVPARAEFERKIIERMDL